MNPQSDSSRYLKLKLRDYVFLGDLVRSLLLECQVGLEYAKSSLDEDALDRYLYRLERLTSIDEALSHPLSEKKPKEE